jgi:TctA family transporter
MNQLEWVKMLTRNQLSLLIVMCFIGASIVYSIPDLFFWLYVQGISPESMGIITSIFTVLALAMAVWLNGFIAEKRYEYRLRRAMRIQSEIDSQEVKKVVKAGNVITKKISGFRFQKSND